MADSADPFQDILACDDGSHPSRKHAHFAADDEKSQSESQGNKSLHQVPNPLEARHPCFAKRNATTPPPQGGSAKPSLYEKAVEQQRKLARLREKAKEDEQAKYAEDMHPPIISPYARHREAKGSMFYEQAQTWLNKRKAHIEKKRAQISKDEVKEIESTTIVKMNEKSRKLLRHAKTPHAHISDWQTYQNRHQEHVKDIEQSIRPSFRPVSPQRDATGPKILRQPLDEGGKHKASEVALRIERLYALHEERMKKLEAARREAERRHNDCLARNRAKGLKPHHWASKKELDEHVERMHHQVKEHEEEIKRLKASAERDLEVDAPFRPTLSKNVDQLAQNARSRAVFTAQKRADRIAAMQKPPLITVKPLTAAERLDFDLRNEKFLKQREASRNQRRDDLFAHGEGKECTFAPSLSAQSQLLAKRARDSRSTSIRQDMIAPEEFYRHHLDLAVEDHHQFDTVAVEEDQTVFEASPDPRDPQPQEVTAGPTPFARSTKHNPPSPPQSTTIEVSSSHHVTMADVEATLSQWRALSESVQAGGGTSN